MISVSVLHTSFYFSKNFWLLIVLGQLSWHRLVIRVLLLLQWLGCKRKYLNKSILATSLDLRDVETGNYFRYIRSAIEEDVQLMLYVCWRWHRIVNLQEGFLLSMILTLLGHHHSWIRNITLKLRENHLVLLNFVHRKRGACLCRHHLLPKQLFPVSLAEVQVGKFWCMRCCFEIACVAELGNPLHTANTELVKLERVWSVYYLANAS